MSENTTLRPEEVRVESTAPATADFYVSDPDPTDPPQRFVGTVTVNGRTYRV
jgi:hypothetical protein